MNTFACGVILLAALWPAASVPYPGWQHSGAIHILATPEGANLPASGSEDGFPLLVRLHQDFLDFRQAKGSGEDVRFTTSSGRTLALPGRSVGRGATPPT